MKNLFLSGILIFAMTFFGRAQITDNSGDQAVGANNQPLNGNLTLQSNTTFNFGQNSKLSFDQGGSLILAGNSNTRTPYIDFYNDISGGLDARLILRGDDILSLNGANFGINTNSPEHLLTVRGGLIGFGNSFTGSTLAQYDTNGARETVMAGNMRLAFIADQVNSLASDKRIIFGAGDVNTDGANFVEYMRIDQGNVAIGATNPSARLQVASPDGNTFSLRIGRLDNHNYWNINHAGNDFRMFNSSGSGSDIIFGIDTNGNAIDNKIGIGTSTPSYKLDVDGDVGVGTELTWGTEAESKLLDDQGGSIRLAGNMQTDKPYIEFQNKFSDGFPDALITLEDDDILSLKGAKLGIGNIAYNADNADSQLIVDGKILCEEVQVVVDVDDAIPDYVFQKYYTGTSALKADYKMPTLEEVEAFTKANHHLPEVPSAKEIQEEGLQLKEMAAILLQKVEELTLYTIEQEKRIKALEAQLAKKQ